MERAKRILRILIVILISPITVAVFCVGIGTMPITYGVICSYFYIKDGGDFNVEDADCYTDAVFDFLMEDMWHLPAKYILKLKKYED